LYHARNKRLYVAAIAVNIPYDRRTKRIIFWESEKKNRFYVGIDLFIHLPDTPFELKIGGGTQAAEDIGDVVFFTEIGGQSFVGCDANLGIRGKDFFKPFQALFEREQVFFFGIDPNGHRNVIEQAEAAQHHGLVSFGYWIEGAGEDGRFVHD